MFPKGVGSLGSLRVSGVLEVSESQNHELYYSQKHISIYIMMRRQVLQTKNETKVKTQLLRVIHSLFLQVSLALVMNITAFLIIESVLYIQRSNRMMPTKGDL